MKFTKEFKDAIDLFKKRLNRVCDEDEKYATMITMMGFAIKISEFLTKNEENIEIPDEIKNAMGMVSLNFMYLIHPNPVDSVHKFQFTLQDNVRDKLKVIADGFIKMRAEGKI